jgi:hypothetical protein
VSIVKDVLSKKGIINQWWLRHFISTSSCFKLYGLFCPQLKEYAISALSTSNRVFAPNHVHLLTFSALVFKHYRFLIFHSEGVEASVSKEMDKIQFYIMQKEEANLG